MRKVIVAVIVLAVAGVAVGLKLAGNSGGAAVPAFEIGIAEKKPLWITVSATGLVELVLVEVKSKASGTVERLPIEMGDAVKKGQIIAELDTTEIKNQLEQGRAAWAVAVQSVRVKEQALRRTEELGTEGLVSEQDLENAKLELERARSDEISSKLAAANLEERLRDTVIRSPMDGIVLEKRAEVGQVISSGVSSVTGGTTIAVIADLSRVYVKADVDETDIGRVQIGQRVEAIPDAFPDRKFEGAVARISPQSQIIQNVTTFQVVTILDNTDGILKGGMNMTVNIQIEGKDEALTVPRRAVRLRSEVPALAVALGMELGGHGGGRAAGPNGGAGPSQGASPRGMGLQGEPGETNSKVVFVKTPDGYGFREVETGLSDYDQYEITRGLGEGDEVVVFLTSRALDQSRQFVERRRGSAIPGLSRSGGGPH
jgi:HlyD family secretion protein